MGMTKEFYTTRMKADFAEAPWIPELR